MNVINTEFPGRGPGFWGAVLFLGALVAAGLGSSWVMEHNGHWITGMDNQIVWGMPHVFAVFLIVAASGALNVASLSSVFGKTTYKPLAPLSGVLAASLLMGGLAVLVLDLGRPDRLIVAMTHYNFKSIFAWNIFLYTGFLGIVIAYVWTRMDRTVQRFGKAAGIAAFLWRLILTTGTGSIFGFLVARQAYDAAVMAPMFIALSLSYGTAIFILVLVVLGEAGGRPVGDYLLGRLRNLLGIFAAVGLYFAALQHLTNLYATEHHGVEKFLLVEGGSISVLFWIGQVAIGALLPIALVFHPGTRNSRQALIFAAIAVVLGGIAQMYVTIIGGQAYPLVLFPEMEVSSSFFDGAVSSYGPSLPEFLLGLSGLAIGLLVMVLAARFLPIFPERLDDAALNPHFKGQNDD